MSIDVLDALREELAQAEDMRLSLPRLEREGVFPVSLGTIYRWLNGSVDPGARLLQKTVESIREFLEKERHRIQSESAERSSDQLWNVLTSAGASVQREIPKGARYILVVYSEDAPEKAYCQWDSPEDALVALVNASRLVAVEVRSMVRSFISGKEEPPA